MFSVSVSGEGGLDLMGSEGEEVGQKEKDGEPKASLWQFRCYVYIQMWLILACFGRGSGSSSIGFS